MPMVKYCILKNFVKRVDLVLSVLMMHTQNNDK